MLSIEACFLLKQHGTTRVLVDLSKAELELSAADAQGLIDIFVESHIPKSLRTAIVTRGRRNEAGVSRVTNLSQEYGYELKAFSSERDARAWLED